jgi:hypothetical protein
MFYEQKSLALEKIQRFLGEKASPAKKFEDFRGGKSLASEKFFLAPLISKSYLPPWDHPVSYKKIGYSTLYLLYSKLLPHLCFYTTYLLKSVISLK